MILNAITAITYFTGLVYGDSADLVYRVFSELKIIDILYGVVLIGMCVLAFVTRSALSGYKKNGPILLCVLYIVGAVSSVGYVVIVSAITNISSMNATIIASVATSVVMVIVNYVYFSKRKDLFVY